MTKSCAVPRLILVSSTKRSGSPPNGKQIRVIYYFDDSASLRAFSRDEVHQEAKAWHAEWYDGYRIEIAEISASLGEGRLTD